NHPLDLKQRRLEGGRGVGGVGNAEAPLVLLGHLVSLLVGQGSRAPRRNRRAPAAASRSRPAAVKATVTSRSSRRKPIREPRLSYTAVRFSLVGAWKKRPLRVSAIRARLSGSGGTGWMRVPPKALGWRSTPLAGPRAIVYTGTPSWRARSAWTNGSPPAELAPSESSRVPAGGPAGWAAPGAVVVGPGEAPGALGSAVVGGPVLPVTCRRAASITSHDRGHPAPMA